MPDKSLRFAFFGNEYQAKKSATMQKMVVLLRQRGAQICIDRPYYVFLTKVLHLDIDVTDVFDGNDFTADFAVSMGGEALSCALLHALEQRISPLLASM